MKPIIEMVVDSLRQAPGPGRGYLVPGPDDSLMPLLDSVFVRFEPRVGLVDSLDFSHNSTIYEIIIKIIPLGSGFVGKREKD
jgi:hypothetical protein